MGEFAIKPLIKIASWVAVAIIVALNARMVMGEIGSMMESAGSSGWWIYVFIIPLVAAAGALLLFITVYPVISKTTHRTKGLHEEKLPLEFSAEKPFRKIAVAVDFSSKDQATISNAIAGGNAGTTFLLIHVVESAAALMMEKEARDHETEEDKAQLRSYAAALQQTGVAVSWELGFGKPSREIPRIVEKFGADLLVMGAHGHRGFRDLIFGETINTVRHRVSIPVLVVK
jgi:manganese transport protein